MEAKEKEGRLLPPKNIRPVKVRVCAFCRHGSVDNGSFVCDRPDGFSWDVGDMKHYSMTCDRYKDRT